MNFDSILNKPLASVNHTRTEVLFQFLDGSERKFFVCGDCCSESWVEHLEKPNDIRGAIITGVEHTDYDGVQLNEASEQGTLMQYFTRFHTNKGDITLEYRNDSNGYYGGYLCDNERGY